MAAHGPHPASVPADARRALHPRRLLASDWYADRLRTKQSRDVALWTRHVAYLEHFLTRPSHAEVARRLNVPARLRHAREQQEQARRPEYAESLRGTIGADPMGESVEAMPAEARPREMAAAVS